MREELWTAGVVHQGRAVSRKNVGESGRICNDKEKAIDNEKKVSNTPKHKR